MHIVISTDTDQYQRIHCNIGLVLPAPSTFDGRQRLVRSEELQHCCSGAQLVVSASDKIECEMRLVLLRVYLPAAASTSHGEGDVIKCFLFTSYLHLQKGWMPGQQSGCHSCHLISLPLFILHCRMETRTYQCTLPLSINWSVNGSFICLQMWSSSPQGQRYVGLFSFGRLC